MTDLPETMRAWWDSTAPDDPARRSSVQLASELPRPRRPMPRVMRPNADRNPLPTPYRFGQRPNDYDSTNIARGTDMRGREAMGQPDPYGHTPGEAAILEAGRFTGPGAAYDSVQAYANGDPVGGTFNAGMAALPLLGARGLFGRRAPVAPIANRPGARIPEQMQPAPRGFVNIDNYPERLWTGGNEMGVNRTRYAPPEMPANQTAPRDPATETALRDPDTIWFTNESGEVQFRAPTPRERAQGRWGDNQNPPPAGSTNVAEPPTRLPVNPTRIPTRASDGSVLPAREPQPFRRTEARSDDLRDAAAMRPRESDAGNGGALDASGQGRTGSPTQRLLPAIRDPATGEVFTDARGHAATFERIPMRDENTALSGTSLDDLADGSTNSGFVTPEGQFLTRPQAMEWAAQQEFGGGALQTRYDAARARWLEATNAGRADPALRAELDAAREALNAARRGPQRPPANPRPDSTLSGSAGGFAIPPVVRRDFQRLAGGRPSPAPSQRALQGPGGRLTAMSRAGAPEMRAPGSAPSGLLQTPKGASQQSAIDPRVILGGGALGMFPTGAATAALVRQNAKENAVIDRMAALNRQNQGRLQALRSAPPQQRYINPGRNDPNRTIYLSPYELELVKGGYTHNPVNGRLLPQPASAK